MRRLKGNLDLVTRFGVGREMSRGHAPFQKELTRTNRKGESETPAFLEGGRARRIRAFEEGLEKSLAQLNESVSGGKFLQGTAGRRTCGSAVPTSESGGRLLLANSKPKEDCFEQAAFEEKGNPWEDMKKKP